MNDNLKYPLTERFKAPQGEGLFAGTMMAFVRLVGCSVGQKVCTACDTDFVTMRKPLGGGLFTAKEIVDWAHSIQHLCITGGEPFDRDLLEIIRVFHAATRGAVVHIETSGTKDFSKVRAAYPKGSGVWITVSPKPGYLPESIELADEVKVIIGGLGDGPGWPTVNDALRWAADDVLVYVQPRNHRFDINTKNLDEAVKLVELYPRLRLSCQMHKVWRTR